MAASHGAVPGSPPEPGRGAEGGGVPNRTAAWGAVAAPSTYGRSAMLQTPTRPPPPPASSAFSGRAIMRAGVVGARRDRTRTDAPRAGPPAAPLQQPTTATPLAGQIATAMPPGAARRASTVARGRAGASAAGAGAGARAGEGCSPARGAPAPPPPPPHSAARRLFNSRSRRASARAAARAASKDAMRPAAPLPPAPRPPLSPPTTRPAALKRVNTSACFALAEHKGHRPAALMAARAQDLPNRWPHPLRAVTRCGPSGVKDSMQIVQPVRVCVFGMGEVGCIYKKT